MRVFNFSAGPSMLPLPALEKAAAEMTDCNGTGQSVMEMSHRSKDYKPIIEKTEALFRELMSIPDNYKVLFVQGGASLQFAMVPLNLAAGALPGAVEGKKALYVDTGIWSKKAADEALKYANVNIAASSKDKTYTYIPTPPPIPPQNGDGEYAYYHITLNNTIVGTHWAELPSAATVGKVPLVTDASSCILSEPLDVSRFGIIYAGAQKNLGPAGVCVVIIRDDLIGNVPEWIPAMLRYDTYAKEGSMYNTPPCYGIYMIGLVLDWVKQQGGVEAVGKKNHEKAGLLYDYLDNSKMFMNPVVKKDRSLMNVVFVPRETDEEKKKDIETRFVAEAKAEGLVNLSGHRLVGGMRASIYNAMPMEGVKKLIAFMEKFEGK
ncbi:MAG: 3-phosphoserine/phosphohydroxythreonine transaminase [Spirochaetaceae bacterium]|jgi:phosphoserine aminotransferase|nr:3-phosphoserine/phosphohydroxythreonine transaminase [Spirochaetaceae bacterium]